MPQVFRMGSYLVYFWSDECNPLDPFMFMFRLENRQGMRRRFG